MSDRECNMISKVIHGECEHHYHFNFRIGFWFIVGLSVIIPLIIIGISEANKSWDYEKQIIDSLDCQGLREYLSEDTTYAEEKRAENRFKWLCVDVKEMHFDD